MHGLVSILDSRHYEMVEGLWHQLEKECGLSGVKITPLPHFSWQIADDYPEPETKTTIQAIAHQTKPFTVQAGGLGIFSGPQPVVFISLARSAELNQLHEQLWQAFKTSAKGLSRYYNPQKWMPHITLIFGEETSQALQCGLSKLTAQIFDWEIEVNNIAFVSQTLNQIGILSYRHDFLQK
jgi:2'-5' RNA ligase